MQQSKEELLVNLFNYHNIEDLLHKQARQSSHHIKLHSDYWGMTLWKGIELNPNNIINENEKLLSEVYNDFLNDRHTTNIPEKFVLRNNVILTQGIQESIDRDIGDVSTVLDYCSLGSDSTAEAEAQTDLQAEFTDTAYNRKQFSTAGSKTRVNQTMKLGMLWDEDDFDAMTRTIKEAGVHWHLSDASKCHARVVSTDFVMDSGDLFVVQINELQENGTL